jgi:hypothetical protein
MTDHIGQSPVAPAAPGLAQTTAPLDAVLAGIEGVLAGAWAQACGSTPPPAGWLTRTTAAITAHLQHHHPGPAYDGDPDPTRCRCRDSRALADLRRRVRQQLAGAVAEGHLDGEIANGMLEQLDLPLLRRDYQVRLGVVVDVEVCATDDDDAYDLAEDAVEHALRHAAFIEIDPSCGERIQATAGDFNDDGTDVP